MATSTQNALGPGIADQPASSYPAHATEQIAGRVLFLGGAAYAAAYVIVGSTQLSPMAALLAIAGTVLVLLGLRSIAR